jgi:putative ABC transport system permease protein
MLRNKGGFILIAVQIAVTMTIMVNAVAIIQERSVDMARPSGLDEANTFALASVSFVDGIDKKRLIDEDLELIRSTAGVANATSSNSFPLRRGGWSEGVSLEPGEGVSDSSTALYFSDEHTIETFALELIEGNNFAPNQVDWVVRESSGRCSCHSAVTMTSCGTSFEQRPVCAMSSCRRSRTCWQRVIPTESSNPCGQWTTCEKWPTWARLQ